MSDEEILKIANHWQQQADVRDMSDPTPVGHEHAVAMRECANELRWSVEQKASK